MDTLPKEATKWQLENTLLFCIPLDPRRAVGSEGGFFPMFNAFAFFLMFFLASASADFTFAKEVGLEPNLVSFFKTYVNNLKDILLVSFAQMVVYRLVIIGVRTPQNLKQNYITKFMECALYAACLLVAATLISLLLMFFFLWSHGIVSDYVETLTPADKDAILQLAPCKANMKSYDCFSAVRDSNRMQNLVDILLVIVFNLWAFYSLARMLSVKFATNMRATFTTLATVFLIVTWGVKATS